MDRSPRAELGDQVVERRRDDVERVLRVLRLVRGRAGDAGELVVGVDQGDGP